MDQESEIVTGIAVTPMNAEDGPQLLPLLEDERERGLEVTEVAADAAYSDGPIRAGLQGDGKTPEIVAYIPEPRPKTSGDGKFTANQFVYDGEKKTVTCPGGGGFGEREREQEEGWFQLLFSGSSPKCVGKIRVAFIALVTEVDGREGSLGRDPSTSVPWGGARVARLELAEFAQSPILRPGHERLYRREVKRRSTGLCPKH